MAPGYALSEMAQPQKQENPLSDRGNNERLCFESPKFSFRNLTNKKHLAFILRERQKPKSRLLIKNSPVMTARAAGSTITRLENKITVVSDFINTISPHFTINFVRLRLHESSLLCVGDLSESLLININFCSPNTSIHIYLQFSVLIEMFHQQVGGIQPKVLGYL